MYFIPNKPGVFATEDEALAATLPTPPKHKPLVPKDKPTEAPAAPQED